MAIFDDLEAEQDRLEQILGGLDAAQWATPSAASGWTVADVVLHLAQSEEAVIASAAGAGLRVGPGSGATVDQIMDDLVRAEREEPSVIFQRWREARRGALSALRAADPGQPMSWVEVPLKPATMATTRLAEHWAHGLDITGPLGIPFPDTDRLRHVAWLAHRSLPYAFTLAGAGAQDIACDLAGAGAQDIACDLIAPDGTAHWRYGPETADSVISGPAGAFCRVAAQRLRPEESGLQSSGPHGAAALRLVRTYAA